VGFWEDIPGRVSIVSPSSCKSLVDRQLRGYLHIVDPAVQTRDENSDLSPDSSPTPVKPPKGPTRIGSAWLAISVAVVLGICLVDFLAQNTESVRIEFFSVAGHVPVVVALLAAAVAGAFIVLIVGAARATQLHLRGRRKARPSLHKNTGTAPPST
jgi:uncharacterized integral membrane protein